MSDVENGWAALLAAPGGPSGVHDRVLRLVGRQVAADAGANPRILAGSDEALAAVTTLRGPADCREFLTTLRPFAERVNRKLMLFPNIDELASLVLFTLTAISETMATPLPQPALDVEETFEDLVADETFSHADARAAALLALSLERFEDASVLAQRGGESARDDHLAKLREAVAFALRDPAGRVAVAAAWDAFLRNFPAALRARTAEWRHLVLAARIVLGTLGGTPMGEVAEALHRRVRQLAAEERA